MEKVAVFLDYANLNRASADAGCEVDQAALLQYLADEREGRFLQAAFAYVPIDPRQEHARDAVIEDLWNKGYVVKKKVGTIAGSSYKCDFDVEMTLDISRVVNDIKPDIVVMITGDCDFIPVVLELRNKGIRVEVASFGVAMSHLLKNRCSGFIDLDYLVDSEIEEGENTDEHPPSSNPEPAIDNSEVEHEPSESTNEDKSSENTPDEPSIKRASGLPDSESSENNKRKDEDNNNGEIWV